MALRALLEPAIARAVEADPELMTVMNPVSRPMRLRLAVLVSDAGLDRMYRQEWAELSLDLNGAAISSIAVATAASMRSSGRLPPPSRRA